MASREVKEMLAAAAAVCDEKKGEDIRILALDPSESGLSDYFLICTGNNDRQTVAITDEIELRLKRDFHTLPNAVEGRRQGEWVLMDYVDFIVHVFLPEKRAFYGLERLRKSATSIGIQELNKDITSAIKAKRPASGMKAASAGTLSKKAAAKKVAGKKAAAKKTTAKKAAAKKAVAKKAVAKKTAPVPAKAPAKRAAAKPVALDARVKKASRKTAPSGKVSSRKSSARSS